MCVHLAPSLLGSLSLSFSHSLSLSLSLLGALSLSPRLSLSLSSALSLLSTHTLSPRHSLSSKPLHITKPLPLLTKPLLSPPNPFALSHLYLSISEQLELLLRLKTGVFELTRVPSDVG